MITKYVMSDEEKQERAIRSRDYVKKMRDVVSDEALLALGMRRSDGYLRRRDEARAEAGLPPIIPWHVQHPDQPEQVPTPTIPESPDDPRAKRREYERQYQAARRAKALS